MLESILSASTDITLAQYLILTGASLLLGLITALVYMYRNTYTKGFVLALVLLPTVVQTVILLVSGNLGAGVAVAGTFSLVRFRSVPGGAREIAAIFAAMAIGLATGMGYIAVAALMTLVVALASLAMVRFRFGEKDANNRRLRVTIPENLDYAAVFDDVFASFTTHAELKKVKTTNLGSMFELQYEVTLRDPMQEKSFIDALRVRNGNLNILLSRTPQNSEEL
ncbi:MAG TPA: DUF4956 domain-containing protein [Candidatus Cryosericum sp.]|nr:DUF4956 domain-containing protein [Candidatus Cryosericum sp.]